MHFSSEFIRDTECYGARVYIGVKENDSIFSQEKLILLQENVACLIIWWCYKFETFVFLSKCGQWLCSFWHCLAHSPLCKCVMIFERRAGWERLSVWAEEKKKRAGGWVLWWKQNKDKVRRKKAWGRIKRFRVEIQNYNKRCISGMLYDKTTWLNQWRFEQFVNAKILLQTFILRKQLKGCVSVHKKRLLWPCFSGKSFC